MVKNEQKFTVTVISESGVVYYGDCEVLFVPSEKDVIAIMAYHTPMIAKLSSGDVMIRNGRSRQVVCSLKSGLVYVGDNEVTVLVNL